MPYMTVLPDYLHIPTRNLAKLSYIQIRRLLGCANSISGFSDATYAKIKTGIQPPAEPATFLPDSFA